MLFLIFNPDSQLNKPNAVQTLHCILNTVDQKLAKDEDIHENHAL